jgi:FHS family L-fucose permease-like MFS transporter
MNTPANEPKTASAGLFRAADGKNMIVTFILVSSLFLLWGFCNGMIDVMDKHFQEELHLTLSQSAWVQFAHYLGYFIMALPAGWLAVRLGYKGGIICGLMLVAAGGLWFIPASHIAQFWAFLLGVCVIAAGLTFLETVANPYTTVLGPSQYAATRINLAQSCNGVGWILGPIAGGLFFYSSDAAGQGTGSRTLWIPYAGVVVVVLILAAVFSFASVPEIKTVGAYRLDDNTPTVSHSIWAHPHFVLGVGAQFLYVAGQCCIFAFFINYMTSQVPPVPNWQAGLSHGWIEIDTRMLPDELKDLRSLADKLIVKADPVSAFVSGQLSISTKAALAAFRAGTAPPPELRADILQDLNQMISPPAGSHNPATALYDPSRFQSISLGESALKLIAENPKGTDLARLNRYLLNDAYPDELPYTDGILAISDKGASFLASIGFFCFLTGRISGAWFLKKFPAHKVLGLYGILNAVVCLVIVLKLGWPSVACVFLSYFFMSIMFPTIFALSIHGLGARTKKASAFIVMSIMGGAILPKVMGAIGDRYSLSRAFIVPLVCFGFVAFYGFNWSRFSKPDSLHILNVPERIKRLTPKP